MNPQAAQPLPDWGTIVWLIGIFGSILSFLLTILIALVAYWAKRVDNKMDKQDDKIGELKVVTGQQQTEIVHIKEQLITISQSGL